MKTVDITDITFPTQQQQSEQVVYTVINLVDKVKTLCAFLPNEKEIILPIGKIFRVAPQFSSFPDNKIKSLWDPIFKEALQEAKKNAWEAHLPEPKLMRLSEYAYCTVTAMIDVSNKCDLNKKNLDDFSTYITQIIETIQQRDLNYNTNELMYFFKQLTTNRDTISLLQKINTNQNRHNKISLLLHNAIKQEIARLKTATRDNSVKIDFDLPVDLLILDHAVCFEGSSELKLQIISLFMDTVPLITELVDGCYTKFVEYSDQDYHIAKLEKIALVMSHIWMYILAPQQRCLSDIKRLLLELPPALTTHIQPDAQIYQIILNFSPKKISRLFQAVEIYEKITDFVQSKCIHQLTESLQTLHMTCVSSFEQMVPQTATVFRKKFEDSHWRAMFNYDLLSFQQPPLPLKMKNLSILLTKQPSISTKHLNILELKSISQIKVKKSNTITNTENTLKGAITSQKKQLSDQMTLLTKMSHRLGKNRAFITEELQAPYQTVIQSILECQTKCQHAITALNSMLKTVKNLSQAQLLPSDLILYRNSRDNTTNEKYPHNEDKDETDSIPPPRVIHEETDRICTEVTHQLNTLDCSCLADKITTCLQEGSAINTPLEALKTKQLSTDKAKSLLVLVNSMIEKERLWENVTTDKSATSSPKSNSNSQQKSVSKQDILSYDEKSDLSHDTWLTVNALRENSNTFRKMFSSLTRVSSAQPQIKKKIDAYFKEFDNDLSTITVSTKAQDDSYKSEKNSLNSAIEAYDHRLNTLKEMQKRLQDWIKPDHTIKESAPLTKQNVQSCHNEMISAKDKAITLYNAILTRRHSHSQHRNQPDKLAEFITKYHGMKYQLMTVASNKADELMRLQKSLNDKLKQIKGSLTAIKSQNTEQNKQIDIFSTEMSNLTKAAKRAQCTITTSNEKFRASVKIYNQDNTNLEQKLLTAGGQIAQISANLQTFFNAITALQSASDSLATNEHDKIHPLKPSTIDALNKALIECIKIRQETRAAVNTLSTLLSEVSALQKNMQKHISVMGNFFGQAKQKIIKAKHIQSARRIKSDMEKQLGINAQGERIQPNLQSIEDQESKEQESFAEKEVWTDFQDSLQALVRLITEKYITLLSLHDIQLVSILAHTILAPYIQEILQAQQSLISITQQITITEKTLANKYSKLTTVLTQLTHTHNNQRHLMPPISPSNITQHISTSQSILQKHSALMAERANNQPNAPHLQDQLKQIQATLSGNHYQWIEYVITVLMHTLMYYSKHLNYALNAHYLQNKAIRNDNIEQGESLLADATVLQTKLKQRSGALNNDNDTNHSIEKITKIINDVVKLVGNIDTFQQEHLLKGEQSTRQHSHPQYQHYKRSQATSLWPDQQNNQHSQATLFQQEQSRENNPSRFDYRS